MNSDSENTFIELCRVKLHIFQLLIITAMLGALKLLVTLNLLICVESYMCVCVDFVCVCVAVCMCENESQW